LTFGADRPFPAEFADIYSMDTFLPVVSREAMVVGSRLAVGKAHRGSAVTLALIAEATRLAVRRRVELGFCDCQPHLINTYARLGFRPCCQTYNDPTGGLVVPLVMLFSDGDYLRRVCSPLLGTALDPDVPTSQLARKAASLLPSHPPVRSLEHIEEYDWSSEIAAGLTGQALRLFEDLDGSQLAQILAHSHIIDIAPASHLIRQGHGTRTMYVLLGGELRYQAGSRQLATAQIGEVVGDVAFFLQTSRAINVIAGPSGARVLSLNEPALRSVMESHSAAAAILLFNLCRMLAARVVTQTRQR
jgi:Cyclic nucleotide-binding domain